MKICAKCRVPQELFNFHKSRARKDGLHPYCKTCSKEYRTVNREQLLQKKKTWYQENLELARTQMRARYRLNPKKYRQSTIAYYATPENRAKKLLSKTKERALKDGIPFNLELDDIIIPTHCPYLGMELTHHLGQGYLDSNSSVDKIIPELGYTKGNVQVISRLANQMKNSATKEQLLTFAHNILKMYT